jgi:hypothetical protein
MKSTESTDNQQPTFITATETSENLQHYLLYYQKLEEIIDQIDSHFVKTLKSHEKDFLTAYRGQMLKVEKELSFLKAK